MAGGTILAYPGRAEIRSIDALPVAVDVQVRKVTELLGATETQGEPLERIRDAIEEVWRADVQAHGAAGPSPLEGTCAALDPALWLYGKWGCSFCERAGRRMPISPICAGCRLDARPARAAGSSAGDPTPAARERSEVSTAVNPDEVWARLHALQGEAFRTTRGLPVTFRVDGDALVLDRVGGRISRSIVERACRRVPIRRVSDLADLYGSSYLYAILTDPRVGGG